MVSIPALWFPILLAAAEVFLVSWVLHMVLKYHRSDFSKIPGEDEVLGALRTTKIPSGDYVFPCPATMKDMRSPDMVAKYESGPVGFLTIVPRGLPAIGKSLVQWFLYSLAIGVVVAYITGRTVGAGVPYFQVFRVAGATAFIAYAGAQPQASIWAGRKWSTTVRHIVDSLVYSLLTAGAFAGFWPD